MQAGKTGTDASMAHTILGRLTSQKHAAAAADMKFLKNGNHEISKDLQQFHRGVWTFSKV